jgi:mono/diheme cytochrome c family protein
MSRRARVVAATVLLALSASGCTTLDNAIARISWFTTMSNQVVVRPFELPRTPPPGSVPITGREDSLDLLTGVTNLANPVPRSPASLERGQMLFDTYCIVCHGPAGHGDGTVVPKFVPPPDLTLDVSKQRSDGYIYAMIKQGRGIMPKYGDKIRGVDRWNVVNYVRKLQGLQ